MQPDIRYSRVGAVEYRLLGAVFGKYYHCPLRGRPNVSDVPEATYTVKFFDVRIDGYCLITVPEEFSKQHPGVIFLSS
jgi:hypothetical protein